MLIRLANSDLPAIIDDEDFEIVRGYNWRLNGKAPHIYAIAFHDGTFSLMHRLITGASGKDQVDHRDHNTLNNKKKNLRVCSHANNMANRKMSKANKLGVRGVYIDKSSKTLKFRAELRKDGKKVRKCFTCLEEAKKWVAKTSKALHDEFACLDGCT